MDSRTLFSIVAMLVGAVSLIPTVVAQTPDLPNENAIRTARGEWNRAVAKRDTAAFRALLSNTYHSASGFGHISGADSAVVFAARLFARRADVLYETHPRRIRVLAEHGLASEYGEWVERWRESSGLTELRGTYYALWRRRNGRWVIEGDVSVPESCSGSDYCKQR